MRVLITGHHGFVGRAMFRAFATPGNSVTGIDIATGVDCRDFFRGPDSFGHWDLVVHCAAVVGGRQTIDGEPLRLACEDLSIDAELFRWALRARPGRIVYFSSAAAYPVHLQQQHRHWKLCESMVDTVGRPDNTYGWVKLTGERLATEANAIEIPTHVFRPFSGYGSDQDQAYPFPAIIARALKHETPFTIWGDGASSRDWVHIDDVVGAVLAVIGAEHFEPVNICTGVETTFDQLATLAMVAAGYHAPIEQDMSAPQGVFRRVGDPTKLHEFYTPRVSIEEGVVRAIRAGRGDGGVAAVINVGQGGGGGGWQGQPLGAGGGSARGAVIKDPGLVVA